MSQQEPLSVVTPVLIGLGESNVFCIRAENGCVLVDAGFARDGAQVISQLEQANPKVGDVKLIVVTHAHYDHVGGLAAVKERFGAKVAVHALEAEAIARGENAPICPVLPEGHVIRFVSDMFLPPGNPAVDPDYQLEDGASLAPFGVDGSIVHTPGHTNGSISVLLSNGDAFVGDLLMRHPFTQQVSLPPIAVDPNQLKDSIAKLLSAGAKRVFVGHGTATEAEEIRRTLL